MTTNSSGKRKNSAKISIIGAACSHAAKYLRSCVMKKPVEHRVGRAMARVCRAAARQTCMASSGDEFIPLADHVVVFVHNGVPAGYRAHAIFVGSAVTRSAGFFKYSAIRRLDVVDRGFAFHPVTPFVGGHVGLGRGKHRGIVSLAI